MTAFGLILAKVVRTQFQIGFLVLLGNTHPVNSIFYFLLKYSLCASLYNLCTIHLKGCSLPYPSNILWLESQQFLKSRSNPCTSPEIFFQPRYAIRHTIQPRFLCLIKTFPFLLTFSQSNNFK